MSSPNGPRSVPIEHFPDPLSQDLHRERLGDEPHPGLERVVTGHCIGIAGDEQDRQIGPAGARLVGDLAPVHAARQRSEEHTSELKSLMRNSYDVFCLKKQNTSITL